MGKYAPTIREIQDSLNGKDALERALSTYPLFEPTTVYNPPLLLFPKRAELNERLLNFYKYREIGFETVGRFLDELEMTMCEIMPYYNELYKTVEIMANLENPFDNVDFIETFKETKNGQSSSEGEATTTLESTNETSSTSSQTTNSTIDTTQNSTNDSNSTTNNTTSSTSNDNGTTNGNINNKLVKSQTPQDDLSITSANINSVSYADEVNWSKEDNSTTTTNKNTSSSTEQSTVTGEATNNATGKTTESGTTTATASSDSISNSDGATTTKGSTTSTDTTEHTFTKKGNQGVNTYAHDMNEFRTSIIDVTNMIINDNRISELFMRVF